MVPFPTPDGPAITSKTLMIGRARSGEALEQPATLVVAETAQASALADVELLHQASRLHFSDSRQRLERAHDLQLGDRGVGIALFEQLFERQAAGLELLLHLRALTPGRGCLRERGKALVGA